MMNDTEITKRHFEVLDLIARRAKPTDERLLHFEMELEAAGLIEKFGGYYRFTANGWHKFISEAQRNEPETLLEVILTEDEYSKLTPKTLEDLHVLRFSYSENLKAAINALNNLQSRYSSKLGAGRAHLLALRELAKINNYQLQLIQRVNHDRKIENGEEI